MFKALEKEYRKITESKHFVLNDKMFRKLVKNVGYLCSANVIASFLSLVTLTILARALGPAAFGILVIIEAYVRSIDLIIRFQPWQAVIRYGAEALEEKRAQDFRSLIKAATLYDIAIALISATVAVIIVPFVAQWLRLDPDHVSLAQIYSLSLAAAASSTSRAVLRLYDRFAIISRIVIITALLRLAFCLVAWRFWGTLESFVVSLALYNVLMHAVMIAAAWRELGRQKHAGIFNSTLSNFRSRFPGIISFFIHSNISQVARLSIQRFDTIIVAVLLTPTAAGLYELAQRIARIPTLLSIPLGQAIYPDIARLWSRGERAEVRRLVYKTNSVIAIAATIGLLCALLIIDEMIVIFFGKAYIDAASLVEIRLVAALLFFSGISLEPALLAAGAAQLLSRIGITVTAGFFVLLPLLITIFGTHGAAWAHVAYYSTWLVLCYCAFDRQVSGRGIDKQENFTKRSTSDP